MTTPTPEMNASTVLGGIFAYLPADVVYTSDISCWSAAIEWLKKEHRRKHPQSAWFGDIQFSHRPPLHSYSEQVDQFHWELSYTRLVDLTGGLRNLVIRARSQATMRERVEANYSAQEVAMFQTLAARLIEHQRGLLVVEDADSQAS